MKKTTLTIVVLLGVFLLYKYYKKKKQESEAMVTGNQTSNANSVALPKDVPSEFTISGDPNSPLSAMLGGNDANYKFEGGKFYTRSSGGATGGQWFEITKEQYLTAYNSIA